MADWILRIITHGEHFSGVARLRVVVQFDREASQTRDYCFAKDATHRAARPDPSLRKERLLGTTIKLSRCQVAFSGAGGLRIGLCVDH